MASIECTIESTYAQRRPPRGIANCLQYGEVAHSFLSGQLRLEDSMLQFGQRIRFTVKLFWIGLMVSIPTAALSQGQFTQWYTNLSAQDVELARKAAVSLYEGKHPQVADQANWSSTDSGAGGTVRVVEANSDGSCIVLRHNYKEGSNLPEKMLNIRRCRKSDGLWLVSD